MSLNSEKISEYLSKKIEVRVYDSVDSTNNEAKRRITDGAPLPCLYAADLQTAGRGRRGHAFYSPKGSGLYMTAALEAASAQGAQKITCAAAVAACEAIDALSEHTAGIKWVNDIYIDGRKVAGILTELVTDDENTPVAVLVGIGLNLTTRAFPPEFADRAGSIGAVEPERLCAEITNRLAELYSNIEDNSIIEKYTQRNLCIGRQVRYTDNTGTHTAAAVGIAPDGGLIVEENGRRTTLSSGEISVDLDNE